MTSSVADHVAATALFNTLIEALSHRVGTTLDPADGMVVLADERQSVKLIIEMATRQPERFYAIVPFADIPEDSDAAATLASQLMVLNADREALDDANLCADPQRGKFCLIKTCSLTMDPVAFIEAIEALGELGDRVATLLDDGPDMAPAAGDLMAALGQRV